MSDIDSDSEVRIPEKIIFDGQPEISRQQDQFNFHERPRSFCQSESDNDHDYQLEKIDKSPPQLEGEAKNYPTNQITKLSDQIGTFEFANQHNRESYNNFRRSITDSIEEEPISQPIIQFIQNDYSQVGHLQKNEKDKETNSKEGKVAVTYDEPEVTVEKKKQETDGQQKQEICIPQVEEITYKVEPIVVSPKKQDKKNKEPNTPSQIEKQYEEQLKGDFFNLKLNFFSNRKNNKDQKNIDKNKLNKTLAPISSSKEIESEQNAEIRAMELQMITTMAQQKKKQNYLLLKEWDKRRAESLAIHRNMIEILQTQIDKRIKSSIQNLEIYTTFLREKVKQEEKYLTHPVINTKYALQNNTISKNVYINCTVILNALSEENNQKCRRISEFIHLIKNDILRDSIQVHLMQSQKQLLRIRQKISGLKASLRKSNTETQQKTSQLALFFNQNSVNLKVESQKDFYSTQIDFLSKACYQTQIQKKLGQHCFEYLQCAISEQLKRSNVIRNAMLNFTKGLQKCYDIETDSAEIQQLSKGEESKLIHQYYSLEQIFDERCLTVFKSHQKLDLGKSLTCEQFSSFLNKFEFEGFDSRVILLKEFNTKYHHTTKSPCPIQNCYIVITVDKWIHLFLAKEKTGPYAKPDVSIRANLKNLELKASKNELLDIIIKDEKRNSMISYFWQTKNQRIYRLQFSKKDNREQFIDYVKKLRG